MLAPTYTVEIINALIMRPKDEMSEVLTKFIVSLLDFAVVAKIPVPSCDTEEVKGKKSKSTSTTRAEVLQELRSKCNSLIFQRESERSSYHNGMSLRHKIRKKNIAE